MATAKDIRVGNYCTRVYTELSGMKTKLLDFVEEIEGMSGPEKDLVMAHVPHFKEIIETIDWKLGIITKVCPFEWEGPSDVETQASVKLMEESDEAEVVAGGYIGG